MLKVFEVAVNEADVTHLYYSSAVAKTTKNCRVILHDNSEIKREVIPAFYCRKKDKWKYIGNLISNM